MEEKEKDQLAEILINLEYEVFRLKKLLNSKEEE